VTGGGAEKPDRTSRPEPEIGATASAEMVVAESDLASALYLAFGESYPPVFATARMVTLMEVAASRVLAPFLGPGELSVGTLVDATHTAATPPGVPVTATARYLGRENGQYRFEVIASDRGGEIGRATHRRAIVTTQRLLTGAARRNEKTN
jgi:predicted thioesterase